MIDTPLAMMMMRCSLFLSHTISYPIIIITLSYISYVQLQINTDTHHYHHDPLTSATNFAASGSIIAVCIMFPARPAVLLTLETNSTLRQQSPRFCPNCCHWLKCHAHTISCQCKIRRFSHNRHAELHRISH